MIEHSFIYEFIQYHQIYGYVLAFLFMAFEGDAPLFVFGFATQQGLFNPLVVFIFLYSGTVIGDAFWYYLGLHGSKFPRIARYANRLASPLDTHIQERPFRTIFFSQFVYGIHHAIWIRAGLIKAPIKRLVKIDIFASIFWVLIVGGLGFAAGTTVLPIGKYVRYTELVLLICLVLFFVIQHFLSKFSKKEL